MAPNVNLNDPAVQAHVFHLITQLGSNQPNAWGAINQGGSQNLEHILTQISQRPEIVANLPGLLNSLAGQQAQQQKLDPSAVAQADGGPASYTAQLYGGAGSGSVLPDYMAVNNDLSVGNLEPAQRSDRREKL